MWTIGLLIAAALVVGIRIARHVTYVRARKAHGCEEPSKYPHKDPFLGLDYWRGQKKAAQGCRWLVTSKAILERMAKHTRSKTSANA